jgi:hypothetical protein
MTPLERAIEEVSASAARLPRRAWGGRRPGAAAGGTAGPW